MRGFFLILKKIHGRKGFFHSVSYLLFRKLQIHGAKADLFCHRSGDQLMIRFLEDQPHTLAQIQDFLLFPGNLLPFQIQTAFLWS